MQPDEWSSSISISPAASDLPSLSIGLLGHLHEGTLSSSHLGKLLITCINHSEKRETASPTAYTKCCSYSDKYLFLAKQKQKHNMKMGRNTLEMGDLNSIPPGKWKDLSADLHLQVSPWTAKLPNKERRKVLQNDYKKLYVGTPALSTDKDSRFPAHRVGSILDLVSSLSSSILCCHDDVICDSIF